VPKIIDVLPAIWAHAVRFNENRVEWHLTLTQAALLDKLLKRSDIESQLKTPFHKIVEAFSALAEMPKVQLNSG
jgi:hypothetical protein